MGTPVIQLWEMTQPSANCPVAAQADEDIVMLLSRSSFVQLVRKVGQKYGSDSIS